MDCLSFGISKFMYDSKLPLQEPIPQRLFSFPRSPVVGIHGGGRVHHLMKGASEGVEELMVCLEKL